MIDANAAITLPEKDLKNFRLCYCCTSIIMEFTYLGRVLRPLNMKGQNRRRFKVPNSILFNFLTRLLAEMIQLVHKQL